VLKLLTIEWRLFNTQDYLNAISNFGFPIVVAGYLLFRFENKIDKLEETINNLTNQISQLITLINNRKI
jgi:hypothetical protein